MFATVIPEKLVSQELDTSVGVSGPHDFAVRFSAVRQERIRVHRIPPRVRDDRDTPLSVGRNGSGYRSDLGIVKTEIFLREGLDTKIAEQPVGQISGVSRLKKLRAMDYIETDHHNISQFELSEMRGSYVSEPSSRGRLRPAERRKFLREQQND